jgi:hypothetical protein
MHSKSIQDLHQKNEQKSNDFLYEENDSESEIDFDLAITSFPLLLVIFDQTEFTQTSLPTHLKNTKAISPIYLEVCNLRV